MIQFATWSVSVTRIIALLFISLVAPSLASGQTSGSAQGKEEAYDTRELHQGILPLIDYTGDLKTRSHLSGDWGGLRSELAQKGIAFRGWITPLWQRVGDGGAKTGSEFGASINFWGAIDFDRMGVIPGGLLVARVESDVGNSTVEKAGTIMAPSYNSIIPVDDDPDDDNLAITNLYYTQFFGRKFGAWAGRFDTHHNANLSEFAGLSAHSGKTQFMNFALTIIPVMPVTEPYVTSLGGGVFARPTRDLALSAMVMDSRESSQRVGLNDFGKDWNAFATVSHQHRLGSLPGGQVVGFSYSWNGDYAKLDENQLPNLIRGTQLESKEVTWAAVYSGWQYIQVFDGDTSKYVNTGDGRVDHRGWGIFLMAGLADKDTNPIHWSVAGGIGGRGILPGRPNDQFGVGYYYIDIKGGKFGELLGLEGSEQGVELYYEAEVVPWFHITPNFQFIKPGLSANENAIIFGLRGNVSF